MFRALSEEICYLLARYKFVNIGEIEIYIYGVEVILLNLGILITISILSLLMRNLMFLIGFTMFFIPLRLFAGGWHANSSSKCFIVSNLLYFISLLIYEYYSNLYKNPVIVLILFLAVTFIIVLAPIVSQNHPLTSVKRKRNKIITGLIGIFDCIMFILLCKLNLDIASVGVISVLLVALLMLPMLPQKIKSKNNDY